MLTNIHWYMDWREKGLESSLYSRMHFCLILSGVWKSCRGLLCFLIVWKALDTRHLQRFSLLEMNRPQPGQGSFLMSLFSFVLPSREDESVERLSRVEKSWGRTPWRDQTRKKEPGGRARTRRLLRGRRAKPDRAVPNLCKKREKKTSGRRSTSVKLYVCRTLIKLSPDVECRKVCFFRQKRT